MPCNQSANSVALIYSGGGLTVYSVSGTSCDYSDLNLTLIILVAPRANLISPHPTHPETANHKILGPRTCKPSVLSTRDSLTLPPLSNAVIQTIGSYPANLRRPSLPHRPRQIGHSLIPTDSLVHRKIHVQQNKWPHSAAVGSFIGSRQRGHRRAPGGMYGSTLGSARSIVSIVVVAGVVVGGDEGVADVVGVGGVRIEVIRD